MRLPFGASYRCGFLLLAFQIFVYSVFVFRFFPLRRNSDNTIVSLTEDELYTNGDLNLTGTNDGDKNCSENFIQSYLRYCEKGLVPPQHVVKQYASSTGFLSSKELCPCLPLKLTGEVNLNFSSVKLTSDIFSGMLPGGHWAPSWCIPRQRIAIIIPFRDRASHLDIFLQVFHPFLQNQLHSYSIFVIEQRDPAVFNKAAMMNVGFVEITKRTNRVFDCFIFHDVDSLPQDDRNIYGCYKIPKHVAAYFDKLNYRLHYYKMFGGATGFTRRQFELSNGYSNEFWGWGGEDDDMEKRIAAANFTFLRYPKCVAKYTMIKHERDKGNPKNHKAASGWYYRPEVYKKDGLNSLKYKLIAYEERILYTRIIASLPVPTTTTKRTTTTTKKTTTTTTVITPANTTIQLEPTSANTTS